MRTTTPIVLALVLLGGCNGDSDHAAAPPPERFLAVEPDPLDLGTGSPGAAREGDVTIRNVHASRTVAVTALEVESFADVFQVEAPPTLPQALAPGATLTARVRFLASEGGDYGALLLVANDAEPPVEGRLRASVEAAGPPPLARPPIERLSVGDSGKEADRGVAPAIPALSRGGLVAAFVSESSNLVRDDRNGLADVFIRDRVEGTTVRASVGPSGEDANGASSEVAVSADGRFVAFTSAATNLVPGLDPAPVRRIFLYDRKSGGIVHASVGSTGEPARGGDSFAPSLSADGRVLAFVSSAPNLVPDDRNGGADVFVLDRAAGALRRASVASDGSEAGQAGGGNPPAAASPQVSADGRFVVFASTAGNLVPDDRNGVADVFVRDLAEETTARVSLSGDGREANGSSGFAGDGLGAFVAAGGRFVVFRSDASNLVSRDGNGATDVFLRDRDADQDGVLDEPGAVRTTRVGLSASGDEAALGATEPSISADGRLVAFISRSPDLVPEGDRNGVADAFVHDRRARRTFRVGVEGHEPDGEALRARIAEEGLVGVVSRAANLVPGDGNGAPDLFLAPAP